MELRPYSEEQREAFISLNTCPINRKNVNGPHTFESASKLFDKILAPSNTLLSRAIYQDEVYLGHIFAIEDDNQWELGFILDKAFWRRGFAEQACRMFVSDNLSDRRLFATVDEGHLASMRILEKLGFKRKEQREDGFGVFYLYIR